MALICEGVSECKILTFIVNRYLGDAVVVNPIQPPLETRHGQEKQSDAGGWAQVLNHCTDDLICEIMAVNDYLVIQIDTDACTQPTYDVNIYDDNNQRVTDDVLYKRVCSRLKRNISESTWNKYGKRILFAVCINETECWLLPLYYENDEKKRCATNNCIYILNQQLQKESMGIPKEQKNTPGAVKVYQRVLKKLKQKDIPRIAQSNYGFQKFVQQLEGIKME